MRSLPSSRPAFHYLVGPNGYRAVGALPRPKLEINIPAIAPPSASSGVLAEPASSVPRHHNNRSCTHGEGTVGHVANSVAHETPFFDLDDGAWEVVRISTRASAALMESQQKLYAGIVWPYCDR